MGAHILTLPDGQVNLSYVLKDLEDDEMPWSYMWDDTRRELQSVINSGSKLFTATDDVDFLAKLAVADCVAQFLIIERGFDASAALRLRDRWLYVSVEERH